VPTKESGDAKVRLGSRFHRLFGATLVSAVGTGMHAAALPLLVLQSTSNPMALSAVVLAAEIPWVGAGLGGVLASVFTVQVSYVAAGVFLLLVTLVFCPVLNNRALASATDEPTR
jgi:hypothetical protein